MTKMLLAEHDAPLGHSLLHLLAKVAILGEWVRSAAELDEWAAKHHTREPSLVLLDWELPGAGSGEPLSLLQARLPSATIVVLSERLSGDDAAVLLSRGVPSIQKPINPYVLSMLALDLCTEACPSVSGGFHSCQQSSPQGSASHAADGHPLNAGPSFDSLVAAYAASRRLSKQQALILDFYLNGKTDKEIAELCACSGATVYEHWRRMAKKSCGRQKSDVIADFHRYLRQGPAPPSATALSPAALRALLEEGRAAQRGPSAVQTAEQPSPESRLPSSHCSFCCMAPSPQRSARTQAVVQPP
jgi:DNA-binding NarL/FixJ family response regulator